MKGKRLLAVLMSIMLTAGSITGAVSASEAAPVTDAGIEQVSEEAVPSEEEEPVIEAAEEPQDDTAGDMEEAEPVEDGAPDGSSQDTEDMDKNESPSEMKEETEEPVDEAVDEESALDTETSERATAADTGAAQETTLEDEQGTIEEETGESASGTPFASGVFDGDSPEDFDENSVPASLGKNTVRVSVTEGELFKFTPDYSDTYTFYTEGSYDTIGSIFGEIDGDMYALTIDDNSGEDSNFSTSYELEKGKAYYLGVIFADHADGSGTREILLRVTRENCSGHWPLEDSGIVKEPTCTEDGFTTYICGSCGQEYEDDYTPARHRYDDSGICLDCGKGVTCTVHNAEIYEDEGGNAYIEVAYTTEYYRELDAYVEIQEEGSDADPYVEYKEIETYGEGTVNIYLYEDLPEYYIIRAYIKNPDGDTVISSVFENDLHTREIYGLLHSKAEDYDQSRTVRFSGDDFGVFSENTVIIHGTASVNIISDTADSKYTITNADAQTEKLKKGCNIAYFYEDELQLVAYVTKVSRPDNKTVVIETDEPSLDDVFEYLRIEEDIADPDYIVDTSGLPEGVEFMGAEEFDPEEYASNSPKGSVIDDAAEEGISKPIYGADSSDDSQAEFSQKYRYSLVSYPLGKHATVGGDLSIDFNTSVKVYKTKKNKCFVYKPTINIATDFYVSGKAEGVIPLGLYYLPLLNGLLTIQANPYFYVKVEGKVSTGMFCSGTVECRNDSNGFSITACNSKFGMNHIDADVSVSAGVDLFPTVYLFPKEFSEKGKKHWYLFKGSCKVGPKVSTAVTLDPMSQSLPGYGNADIEHLCNICFDGSVAFTVDAKATVLPFLKVASSTKSINIKLGNYYYSVDYNEFGWGTCPHVKEKDDDGDDDDDDDDDEENEEAAHVVFDLQTKELKVIGSGELIIGYYFRVVNWENVYGSDDRYGKLITFDREGMRGIPFTTMTSLLEAGFSYDTIEIPSGITHVEFDGPYDCDWIKSIKLPGGVKSFIFENTRYIERVELSEGITEIPDCAFEGCEYLETVIIPSSVVSIGDQAFSGCKRLKSVTTTGVNSIGERAFAECTGLESAIIGGSVKCLVGTFEECSSLVSVSLPNSVTNLDYTFYGCESLTSVNIPNNVKEITDAFSGCSSLKNVTIPSSVTKLIGAFAGCSSLKNVTIPSGITNLDGAFSGCASITNVTIPPSVTSLVETFSDCTSLTNITIPSSVKKLNETFSGCTSLASVTIEDGVSIIHASAFSGCTSLTRETLI